MYTQVQYVTGDKLPNGATVVKTRSAPNGDHFVLATWGTTRQEWITWAVNRSGDTCNGNYFFDEQEGLEDLEKRAS